LAIFKLSNKRGWKHNLAAGNDNMIMVINSPNLLTTYLPRNPVAPKTVATTPLNDERPPLPCFGSKLE
jgi:hypothetical protein